MLGCGGGQGSYGKRYGGCGGDVGKCVGVWGEVRKDVWGGCGKVYGVSGEVCWRVWKGCGERNGEDVGKCVEVWGPNTLLISHISLPSPFPTSPLTSPIPHHTFLHLLSYLLPHPSFLSPHPSTFSYYPHTSPFTFSKCGEVTMRRSFCGEVTVAKLPCGEVTGNLPHRVSACEDQFAHQITTFDALLRKSVNLYHKCLDSA